MSKCDLILGGVPFMAMEPRDAAMFRRGGLIVWARWRQSGLQLLSVHEVQIISAWAPCRPPGADVLLVSPGMTNGRRRRELLKLVQAALWSALPTAAE